MCSAHRSPSPLSVICTASICRRSNEEKFNNLHTAAKLRYQSGKRELKIFIYRIAVLMQLVDEQILLTQYFVKSTIVQRE